MNRGLLVMMFLSLAVTGTSQVSRRYTAKHSVLYAPRPEYPLAAQKRHWTGTGVFACSIRCDGNGKIVDIVQRTGHQIIRCWIRQRLQLFGSGDSNPET